jgi:16S rRNA (cytidine1402-2'-O)-methyltransferase
MLRVCPTPIGNLGDITSRVLEALKAADLVAAEDTRRTRQLLTHYGISKPLVSFFEHNEIKRLPELLERLRAGEDIALVSDAGMPGICDPGYRLISAALDEGLAVEVLPGPSALETALVSSGFATDSFFFLGYLPRRQGDLDKTLTDIAGHHRTCVAYESPHRLLKTLTAAAAILGERRVAVCRELTKKFEEVTRGTAHELATALPEKVRGEIVLVFEGSGESGQKEPAARANIEASLRGLMEEGISTRRAAQLISLATGLSQNRLYKIALEIKKEII